MLPSAYQVMIKAGLAGVENNLKNAISEEEEITI